MAITKHGVGAVVPEEGDDHKTAKKNFTAADREALIEESQEEED